ncbi:ATP-binding protein [Rhodanobacter sp. DHG33]|uniref:ATP-binding protein n=1 Tax=Rhodanobacter sp. DHG33 TaxID=2775921 RepID=UPI00178281B8|nr:ATP-binding protein [Rhodanobacter sp. DHG33]MBD8898551.1 ATP-binding protein [Rhodanobacter sp. DHG33]
MKLNDPGLLNILSQRENQDFWDSHPVVCAGAVLPTGPIGAAIPLVIEQARLQRGSVAFWARPFTGKSSFVRALKPVLRKRFPGCGIVVHEAKSNDVIAEGSFIADMLLSVDYQGKVPRDLPGKRNQIRRALFALGAERRHVICIIDEAQELDVQELIWLKEQANWLTEKGYKVTTVLIGQQELLDLRDQVLSNGRSDLVKRFFLHTFEFELIKKSPDLEPFLAGCDEDSEYPEGSGWSYTQTLWPTAFASGFRLGNEVGRFWFAFSAVSPLARGEQGISMDYVAGALSQLANMTRERDGEHFRPTSSDWAKAIELAGYAERAPLVRVQEARLRELKKVAEA